MSFLGDGYRVGDSIPIFHFSTSAANEEAVPDWGPYASFFWHDGAGGAWPLIVTVQLSPVDFMDRPGLYGLLYLLDGDLFEPGKYTILTESRSGTYLISDHSDFEIKSGGNSDGPVLSMGYWARPEGVQVLAQLASGKVGTGYGPAVISG